MKTKNLATVYAIVAAALYAINVPFSKMLLGYVEPTMMAAFLYLGAGLGMFVYSIVCHNFLLLLQTFELFKRVLKHLERLLKRLF